MAILDSVQLNNVTYNIGPKESYLQWGGQNFSGNYGVIDAALVTNLGANRLAFANAAGVTIEYSTDGGTTWVDYGATDTQKRGLTAGVIQSFALGKHTTTGSATTNDKLRIIIDSSSAGIYTKLLKFVIKVSVDGASGCTCTIDAATNADTTTFTEFAKNISLSGWPGYNVINIDPLITYGNNNSQYRKLRFTFSQSGVSSTGSSMKIQLLQGFGGDDWTVPSNMARTGHLYSYDGDQNATFPAKITASSFVGSGASLTALNASNISSGTLAVDRLPTSGVTAGTYGPNMATTGSEGAVINIPEITVDNKGRVTNITNRAYTSKDTNTDTKNTAGSTNTASKIFLIGATEQAANPQTYSNSNVYVTNGLLFAPQIQTGTAATSYFQSQKFRGQGDAASYYHAIDFGYAGHNQVDFYEYGGVWNFWLNKAAAATSDAANRVASLQLGKLIERGNTLTYPNKSGTFALTSDILSHSHSAGVGLTGSGNAGTTNDTYTYKVNLVNETVASNASTYTAGGSSKFYAVQLDKNSKLGVYVPWTDTNTDTTYSAGTGISLSGTTFSNSGVRSIATGGTNGTIAVNTNGTTTNVAVKGLGTAAYTASTAYAASGHTHNYAGSSSAGGPLTAGVTWAADAANASRTLWFSSSASTTTVGKPAFDNDLTYNPSTNLLSVGQVKIGSGCTLQYNTTNKTLDFIFA